MTIRLEQYPVCGDALLEEGVEHRVKDPLPPATSASATLSRAWLVMRILPVSSLVLSLLILQARLSRRSAQLEVRYRGHRA